jgi:hypothetical protein
MIIALVFLAAWIIKKDTLALMAAVFFGFQAVFNTGCCLMSCNTSTPKSKATNDNNNNIEFEEIK